MRKRTFSISIDSPDLAHPYERLVVEAHEAEEAKRVAAALAIRDSKGRGMSSHLASLNHRDAVTAVANYATVTE